MDNRTLLDFMAVAEKLKCNTRHSWTSSGRHESVAEHTYRLCVFAWLVKEDMAREFPDCDMDKVMKMCLFHDLGEAVTGDVPCFEKKKTDHEKEAKAIEHVAGILPAAQQEELLSMIQELEANKTPEAKIVHALDKMEALIQHNEASIDTWLPLEYELQMTYGQEQAQFSTYLRSLRKTVEQDSVDKIEEGK
ncbi:HD domain-containing protein [Bariatricus sp. SGI.154]|uniref:HD domain-containing protein n=1 Tax=Bariatricus sp. SGI.154 TaxID=3420549 RepID=UPI003CFCEF61